MAVKLMQNSGRISALALVLATLALPMAADAQEEGSRFRDREAAGNIGGGNEARRAPRSAPSEGGWARPAQVEPPRAAPATVAMPSAAPASGWNRSAGNGGWEANRARPDGGRQNDWGGNRESGREGWNGSSRSSWNRQATAPTPAPPPAETRNWSGSSRSSSWGSDDRQRAERTSQRDGWRSDDTRRDGRDWNRDGRREDRSWNSSVRDAWRSNPENRYHRDDRSWDRDRDRNWDRNRWGYNQDYRRWDNRWRSNKRYDWYSYRRTNPHFYRLPAYYAPYRNYSYRRLSIGFFLDSLFFTSNYWINDPWHYRLPDVYGPYRWVRYYDDALLVNIHTGEVVDVIYSFFW